MTDIPCVVCRKKYDGTTHCSVAACRACSMFFKRCQTFEAAQYCTLGNSCKLDEPGRINCSYCRYQKCLRAGLKIQATKRSLKSKQNIVHQNTTIRHTTDIILLDQLMPVPEAMITIKRYCYNYALNANAIKRYELMLLREDGEELIDLPGNRKMGYMTQSRSDKLLKFGHSVLILHDVFSAFSTIGSKEQDSLIDMLMMLSFDLHSSYQTLKVFNDVNTTRIICSEAMFADFDDMGKFMDNNNDIHPMDLKTLSGFFSTCVQHNMSTTMRLLDRIKITDVEYLAVCCLFVWEEDNFIHFPHLRRMVEVHRNLIYKDLDHYYKKILRLDNYVKRIMNLKELLKTLRKNLIAMTESMHFLRVFNYYEGNEDALQVTQKVARIITED